MENDTKKAQSSKVTRVDGDDARRRLDELVAGTVEETLKAILDAKADKVGNVQHLEHSPKRMGIRADGYTRKLHPRTAKVEFSMPKSRWQPLET